MSNPLKDRLSRQVMIFDGAVGTEIYRHNFFINTCFESLSLSAPKVIGEIHKSYADAGAEVITTNTFNANFNKLSRFGMGDKVDEINAAGVELVREYAGEDVLIAASVGPVGDIDYGSGINEERIVEILAEQIEALEKAGADFILFESLGSAEDTERAIKAIQLKSSLPYILSFSLDRNAETVSGENLDVLMKVVSDISGEKPAALGLNCGEGPESTLSALESLMKKADYPIIVQPNAGVPKKVDNRMIYMTSPEYFSTYALRYANMGARGVGGCCGIGPDHIRDMARTIKPLAASEFKSELTVVVNEEEMMDPVPMAEKSDFARKLAAGEWVTGVEITPPRGFDLTSTIAKAAQCKAAGVDVINLPDGPRASSRISPLVTAIEIQEKAGIEVILHFCCRDKNLIGMQADILGCACKNINNILFITGDPPKLGDYPFSSGVFDVDSIGMVKIQSKLNRGLDIGGKPLGVQTRILSGVGADPNAIDMEREYRRTCEKAESGAEFIITQPVFAVDPLIKFVDRIAHLKIPVIAGIWPLASYRNAEFMRNEVPGVVVPDEIMTRMAAFSGKDEQREEGIKIARESIDAIRSYVQGVQVSAPFGNVNTAIAVLQA
ncbi:MAG: bifunctional homocysteine S-methyltransferase/methylenetetrahydrofolate reductase [Victivallales bacterium]|nr:bifunctional homocysteine S-methyltransferase/methylenetetrahydrofolate reductase [Victivallales bacterium]